MFVPDPSAGSPGIAVIIPSVVDRLNANASWTSAVGWERLHLDDEDVERTVQAELADTATPEVIFEREWGRALLGNVLKTLEAEFDEAGKSALFVALKPHLAGDPGALPCQEIATRVGATLTGIKVSVHRARKRYQERLRTEVHRLSRTLRRSMMNCATGSICFRSQSRR